MLIYESYANNANCEYWQLVDWYIIRIFASWFLNHFNQYKPNYSKLKSVSRKGLTSYVDVTPIENSIFSAFFQRLFKAFLQRTERSPALFNLNFIFESVRNLAIFIINNPPFIFNKSAGQSEVFYESCYSFRHS